jgi:hypothetical protein
MNAPQREFVFTREMLGWVRKHAGIINLKDMAEHLCCAPSTLDNICRKFEITLCETSDKHLFIAPVPGLKPEPERVEVKLPPKPKASPRLDPALRSNLLRGFLDLRVQQDALAILNREAAKRMTTAAVLASVLIEIIATDNLFDAVLNLDD